MKNHKLIIVSFLKAKRVASEFKRWSNHITIVPWFNTIKISNTLEDIREKYASIDSIPYEVGVVAYFGPLKDVKVSQVEISEALLNLHKTGLEIALNDDKYMDIKFCDKNYRPHITHNNKPYPERHNKNVLKTIYVVEDCSPVTKTKRVLAAINLKH